MDSFSLQEVKFFELLIVIMFYVFRIVSIFSPFLEDVTLPRGVVFFSSRREQYSEEFLLRRFLPFSSRYLNLERFLCLLMSLYSSDAEDLSTAMLYVVLSRSQCYMKVARSPVSGLKPCEINMALCLLGALLARESTSSDSSSSWFSSNRDARCAILD